MFKGGYIDFQVCNKKIVVEAYVGDESCAYGSRQAQYPIEIEFKLKGNSLNKIIVVNNDAEFNGLHQQYQPVLWLIEKILELN